METPFLELEPGEVLEEDYQENSRYKVERVVVSNPALFTLLNCAQFTYKEKKEVGGFLFGLKTGREAYVSKAISNLEYPKLAHGDELGFTYDLLLELEDRLDGDYRGIIGTFHSHPWLEYLGLTTNARPSWYDKPYRSVKIILQSLPILENMNKKVFCKILPSLSFEASEEYKDSKNTLACDVSKVKSIIDNTSVACNRKLIIFTLWTKSKEIQKRTGKAINFFRPAEGKIKDISNYDKDLQALEEKLNEQLRIV